MSQSYDSEEDQDFNVEIDLSDIMASLVNNPTFIQQLALQVRNQMVGPMARRMGNTAKTTADKKQPLASKPQVPGTKRLN